MEQINELVSLSSGQLKFVTYFLMVICQICQSWSRAWNIKAIGNHNKLQAHISWQLYGWVWLIGTGLGLKVVSDLDILGILIYFSAGAIGLEIGMKNKNK